MATETPLKPAQLEYLNWLLLTDGQRALAHLPASREAYAEAKNSSTRTLRRWEKDTPAFTAELERRRALLATNLTPGAASGAAVGIEPGAGLVGIARMKTGDGTFDLALDQLNELIAKGDRGAIDIYLKSPLAKALMDAQLAAQKSDFAELTDEQLASKLLAGLSSDELAGELLARGWQCLPPAGEPEEAAA